MVEEQQQEVCRAEVVDNVEPVVCIVGSCRGDWSQSAKDK